MGKIPIEIKKAGATLFSGEEITFKAGVEKYQREGLYKNKHPYVYPSDRETPQNPVLNKKDPCRFFFVEKEAISFENIDYFWIEDCNRKRYKIKA